MPLPLLPDNRKILDFRGNQGQHNKKMSLNTEGKTTPELPIKEKKIYNPSLTIFTYKQEQIKATNGAASGFQI